MDALGLVTCGIGIRMIVKARDMVTVAVAIVVGGLLGLAIGIPEGIERFADWAKQVLGGQGNFTEAIVAPSVLFVVGPVTLLGCIQDAVERKIELLAIKSTMDGVAAIFFAMSLGPGVLVSAAVVLVLQGLLTLFARPLAPMAQDAEMLDELSGAGGVIMLAIGLSLLSLKSIPTAAFLPALALAPLIVLWRRKWGRRSASD